MVIGDMEALRAYLEDVQRRGESLVRCELTPGLTARVTDAKIVEALVTGLPMAQGIQRRIVRSRGRGARVAARVCYRAGVRMLAHHRGAAVPLSPGEEEAFDRACAIAAEALREEGEAERLQFVYEWACTHVRYENTAPGQKGYDCLVSACGALVDGRANCQGFADAMYLLCGLCGIAVRYRCGRGERQLHVWNEVLVGGAWREVDASKGARAAHCLAWIDKSKTKFCGAQKNSTQDAKTVL